MNNRFCSSAYRIFFLALIQIRKEYQDQYLKENRDSRFAPSNKESEESNGLALASCLAKANSVKL